MEGPLLRRSDDHIVDVTINGNSSSTDEHTPQEGVWILFEFVATLLQIVAAIVVLIQPKDEEHPHKILVTLIIGYTCGCIATLPILCWRFSQYSRWVCPKTSEVMDKLKEMLDYFFVGWVVVLLWHLIDNLSSLAYTTQHFWLCLAFLVISCIRHVYPNLRCAVLCCLIPLMLRLAQVFDFIDFFEYSMTAIGFTIVATFGCIIGIIWCTNRIRG